MPPPHKKINTIFNPSTANRTNIVKGKLHIIALLFSILASLGNTTSILHINYFGLFEDIQKSYHRSRIIRELGTTSTGASWQACRVDREFFHFSDITMYIRGLFPSIISLLALVKAEWNTKDFQKREHSLVKPYQGSGFGVPNWDFQVGHSFLPINEFGWMPLVQGSTMVTSNYIRLTPDQRSKQGAIWNKLPCKVGHLSISWC